MKTIIIACSGGPDSMALLDMMNQKHIYNIVVAHVNYQKRESALRDEEYVKEYCEQNQLLLHVLKPIYDHSDNFQAWARNVRYQFFELLCQQYHCKEIYVAHHMDDHIETYFFQKNRHMLCDAYGLQEKMNRNEYEIVRPLLSYTKKELEQYCIQHHVCYGIDESNLTNDYTRNKIRHSQIDFMTKEDKLKICDQIKVENEALNQKRKEALYFLQSFKVDDLISLSDNWFYLDVYLYQYMNIHLSRKHLLDLCEKLKKDIYLELNEYYLERYQNQLYCGKRKENVYVQLDSLTYQEFDRFKLLDSGKTIEGMKVSENDFPLVIRNVQEKDCIQLRFGTKNIHRFFIDRKIPRHIRQNWLVVENNEKHIIFVPEIGCDVEHFSVNSNLFMIQYNL